MAIANPQQSPAIASPALDQATGDAFKLPHRNAGILRRQEMNFDDRECRACARPGPGESGARSSASSSMREDCRCCCALVQVALVGLVPAWDWSYCRSGRGGAGGSATVRSQYFRLATFKRTDESENTMSTLELTRAWDDVEFREGLDAEALAQVPANPAGDLISDLEVADPEIAGAYNSWVPCFFSLEKTDSCCAY